MRVPAQRPAIVGSRAVGAREFGDAAVAHDAKFVFGQGDRARQDMLAAGSSRKPDDGLGVDAGIEALHDVSDRNEPGRKIAERGVGARMQERKVAIHARHSRVADLYFPSRPREEVDRGEPNAECAWRERAMQIELHAVTALEA